MLLRVPLLWSGRRVLGVLVQASTKIHSRLIDGLIACFGPEVELISRSGALEALEGIAAEMRREGAVFPCISGSVEGTGATDLVTSPGHDDKPREFQHFGHRNVRSKLPKVDPWHAGVQPEQRRGTRKSLSYSRHNTLFSEEPE